MLLLIFVAGYSVTFVRFEAYALEYAVVTELAVVACSLLLTRLGGPLQVALPFWVLLGLFLVAYYLKFYWIVTVPQMNLISQFYLQSDYLSSTNALMAAFITTTYAFAAFCFAGWLVLGWLRRALHTEQAAGARPSQLACDYRLVSTLSLVAALVLVPLTAGIMGVYGIAVMGVEGERLPYHLAGLVYFTHGVLVPALLVLLFWSSWRAGLSRRTAFAVCLILLNGLVDMLLRSSRSGLLAALTLLVFVLLVEGHRIRVKHVMWLTVGLVLAAFLFPVVSLYRNLRFVEISGSVLSLFATAEHTAAGGGLLAIWNTLALGASSVLLRLTGIDMLAIFHGTAVQPLGSLAWAVMASPGGIPRYVTVNIMGFSPDAVNAAAPGLVGWFYLLGGNIAGAVGTALLAALAGIAWRVLGRLRLRSLPVAQVLFLSLLMSIALDGTIDTTFTWTILVWPLSAAGCEWLCRLRSGLNHVGQTAPQFADP